MSYIDEHTLFFLSGNTLFDETSFGKMIQNKDVVTSTEQSKFVGEKSLYFNGSSSRMEISIPIEPINNKRFEFTIDGWLYLLPKTVNFPTPINYRGKSGNDGIYEHFQSDTTIWRDWNGSSGQQTSSVIPINQWFHLAIVKSETMDEFYINGKLVARINSVTKNPYDKLILGQLGTDPNTWFKGYIQHLRVSDVARWNTNFIPPTDPYIAKLRLTIQTQNPPSYKKPYFVKVFTVNQKKRINSRADLVVDAFPKHHRPPKPTSYIKIADYTASGSFEAMEHGEGWYQIDAVSASGDGERAWSDIIFDGEITYSGAGGGSGAISRKTAILLEKSQSIRFEIIDNEIRIPQFGIIVTPGGVEKQYDNGSRINSTSIAGTAVGGDLNYNGKKGGDGLRFDFQQDAKGGLGGTLDVLGYNLKGGKGGDVILTDGSMIPFEQEGEPATNQSFIRIYRGNTNETSN